CRDPTFASYRSVTEGGNVTQELLGIKVESRIGWCTASKYQQNDYSLQDKEIARMKVYYETHKEKLSAYGKEYYKRNRETELHRFKAYREKNLGRDLERKKLWYARNRDKILAYAKAYDLKNRDKRNAYQRERRRRMKEAAKGATAEVAASTAEPSMKIEPVQHPESADDHELTRRMKQASLAPQLKLSFLLNPTE
ncbi:hypothetical protein DYB25_012885, partial [Aphanomyces astaci]